MTRQIRCDIEVEILTGGAGRGTARSDAARAADLGAGSRLCVNRGPGDPRVMCR